MKIIINTVEDRVDDLKFENAAEGEATYEFLTAVLFCIAENLTLQVKEDIGDDPEQLDQMYDYLAGVCDQLLTRTFPDIQPAGFGLSDAAVLYAEDQIIKRAAKKRITFEEALAEYEQKARDYVAKRGGHLVS